LICESILEKMSVKIGKKSEITHSFGLGVLAQQDVNRKISM